MEKKEGMVLAGLGLITAALFLGGKKAAAIIPPPPAGKANLYGLVQDSVTGQPIEGVAVAAGSYQDTTLADGTYLISNIELGSYILTFSKDGYNTVVR